MVRCYGTVFESDTRLRGSLSVAAWVCWLSAKAAVCKASCPMENAITLEERSIAETSADCISFKNETKVAVVVTSRIISKVVFTRH